MADTREDTLEEVKPRRAKRFLLLDLVIRLVKEKPIATAGGVIVLIMFITGIFADFLAPYNYVTIHLRDCLSPPSALYLLGTDDLGRDLLSRIIYGARVSMTVGLACSSLCTLIAVIIGLPSGFYGGKFDIVIQRFVDAWMCLPGLFITLTLMSLVGRGMVQVIIVIGVSVAIGQSRVVRSAVIAIKQNAYVEATVAVGCSNWRILTRHILPNVLAPIIIIFTVSMGASILMEAGISFLGFGIPPPIPSWGGMLSGSGRQFMLLAPGMAIWPGLALSLAVYGINMLGDGLRDILDPRLRGGVVGHGRVKLKKSSPQSSTKSS